MKRLNILDISIYQIQLFLTLAEVLSFSRAASIQSIAQPTLSIRISALEDAVGVKLFDRDKRPIELTEPGKSLYIEWKDLVEKFERTIDRAKTFNSNAYARVVVCSMDYFRRSLALETAVNSLEGDFNELKVFREYSSASGWRRRLQAGEIDIMLTIKFEEPFIDSNFDYEEVITCPMLVCMQKTNPLSAKVQISFEDLKDQHFIIVSPYVFPAHYDYLRRNCNAYGFDPNISRYVDRPDSLVWNIKRDNEITLCDVFFRNVDSPLLKLFELPDAESGLLAVWRKNDTNPWISKCISVIKQMFIDYPPRIIWE